MSEAVGAALDALVIMQFAVARITDPAALAHVGPNRLVELIQTKAPRLLLRLGKSPTSDDIVAVLHSPTPDDDADALFVALHGIDRICSADDPEELLVNKGIAVGGATIGDALAEAAMREPTRFESAVDLATVIGAGKGSTFTLFRLRVPVAIPSITSSMENAFRAACAAQFADLGHGSHCAVRRYQEPNELGFLVDHGGLRRTKRDLNERDLPETRTGRPVRHDIVLVNTHTGKARIRARAESERVFYAATLGSVLLGDASAIVPAENYVLDAVLAPNYREVLDGLVDGEIESVAVREIRFAAEDDFGTREHVSSRDALGSLAARGYVLDAGNGIGFVRFGIVPRARRGRRCFHLSVWKGNKRKHDAPWGDPVIEEFIRRLRLRRDAT